MPKIEAVCYDLDGTLLNSLADIATTMNTVLRELGHPEHPVAAFNHFIGDGSRVLAERTLPEAERTPETISRAHRRFEEVYQDNWNRQTRPYDGIGDLLEGLAGLGIRQAVLSNKPHRFTVQCVESLLAPYRFDAVLGQREGINKKPDPAGLLEIAEQWQIAPGAIAYVGDTLVDMKTAVNAGAYAVGVKWGFREEEELWAHGAQKVVAHPQELLQWLQEQP